MEAVLSDKVLILNRAWVAVNVATVRRALMLVYQGAARVVGTEDYTTYDFDSWVEASRAAKEGRLVRAISFSIRAPEVVLLTQFAGAFSQEVKFSRRNIFDRDHNTCQYCGRRFERSELTLDHVIPRCQGGMSAWDNIVVACLTCNTRKGNRLPTEAGLRLMRQPMKPRWATRVGCKLGRVRKRSWERFLDAAYWDIELKP
jgi:5-methylcytosine-specific restriction endonuclease McrA